MGQVARILVHDDNVHCIFLGKIRLLKWCVSCTSKCNGWFNMVWISDIKLYTLTFFSLLYTCTNCSTMSLSQRTGWLAQLFKYAQHSESPNLSMHIYKVLMQFLVHVCDVHSISTHVHLIVSLFRTY